MALLSASERDSFNAVAISNDVTTPPDDRIPLDDPRFEGAEFINEWARIEDRILTAAWVRGVREGER
jgi:hypothetical protein